MASVHLCVALPRRDVHAAHGIPGGRALLTPAVLSVAAVVLAWTLVHLVFTLRYAHTYYDADKDTGQDTGGLVFPDDQCNNGGPKLTPNYLDFAYFSFIIVSRSGKL